MTLTSLHYAKLIMWLAFNKCNVALNKTQVQKMLFICYGLYMVMHNDDAFTISRRLFEDDTPKAWPFGPVFPRSYKRYSITPVELTEAEKDAFRKDGDTLTWIWGVVRKLCKIPAGDLTRWSHQEGSPWSKALFARKGKLAWNAEISDSDIYNFFRTNEWQQGLTM